MYGDSMRIEEADTVRKVAFLAALVLRAEGRAIKNVDRLNHTREDQQHRRFQRSEVLCVSGRKLP